MAIEFDGIDANKQVLVHSTLLETMPAEVTMSFWFQFYTTPETGLGTTYLVSKINKQTTPYDMLRVAYSSSDGKIEFQKYASSATRVGIKSILDKWDTRIYYHACCCYSTTYGTAFYINGVSQGSNGDTAPVANGTDRDFCVGALDWNPVGSYEWVIDGAMRDVRLYNRFLFAGDAREIYNRNGADQVPGPFLGRWSMNEKKDGTVTGGKSIIDSSGVGNHLTPLNNPIYRAAPETLFTPMGII